jgi:nicotinamide-nucleotide amidase
MEALAEAHLLPYLRERTGRAIESFTLRCYGAFESQLHERIGALPDTWPGTSFAYLPSWFGVDLRVTVSGTNPALVHETRVRAYNELFAKVKNVVYAEGGTTMEEVVGTILTERGWKVATAESCTGGLLAKRLTDVPGSSRYVERGFVTYSNAAKLELLGVDPATLEAQGAVSAAVAEQMAQGAAKAANAQVGVGITGIAGPEGGSESKPVGLVYLAFATPLGTFARMLRLAGSRATIRERSVQTALDFLRRHLLELPVDPSLD